MRLKRQLIFVLLFPLMLSAQYLEEQNALEAIYESRTRQVLGAILSPKDFSVVVAVELDRDELKLKQFRESVDNQYLPGMPMMGEIPTSPQNNNRLHEMKSRVDINIILLKNLGPDVEKLVKDLVTAKLALDVTAGDYVKVKRAAIADDLLPENKSPDLLPDLSWKMWFLVLILSLLAFSGLLFLAWRLSKKTATQHLINEDKSDKAASDGNLPNEPALADQTTVLPSPTKEDPLVGLIPISEIKVQLAKMVEEIPDLMSASLSQHIMSQSPLEVAYFMEHIGWEQGKIWFRTVPALAWARVGLAFKQQSGDPRASDFTHSVQRVL
jgi:flagellar motor switch protein FliG